VRRVGAEHRVDLAQVQGTGRGGRVTKQDVLAFIEREPPARERPLHSESPYRPDPGAVPGSAPSNPALVDELGGSPRPLSRVRQSIGAAMRRSQNLAATCHTIVECDLTTIEARRRKLELTALPLIAESVVKALRKYPDLNARLDGSTITRYDRVHLGIAVSLGDDGLIVPVVRDAQHLSATGLARAIRDLATRARTKALAPDDVQGATFTITNPGAFGATIATPVIDVPQVGILDLEAVVRRPVVVSDGSGGESIAIRSMMNLILGWDHRAMDGVYAARFLGSLRALLESDV
jgi:pyruvate/2-oxoglutarate dehydrogenase complex dihydrolipoamide acyltransferase (E2) component